MTWKELIHRKTNQPIWSTRHFWVFKLISIELWSKWSRTIRWSLVPPITFLSHWWPTQGCYLQLVSHNFHVPNLFSFLERFKYLSNFSFSFIFILWFAGTAKSNRWQVFFLLINTLLTNLSARAGYDTRSIFKRSLTGLNSEFSFS